MKIRTCTVVATELSKVYFKNAVTIAVLVFGTCSLLQAQILTDSNLPIVIINTDGNVAIPDGPRVLGTMKIIYRGEGQRNYVSDQNNSQVLNYNGRIDIEIRGSSSQELPKKQYGFTTRMADNVSNNNVSLLGMPIENDWVLNGFAFDASLMRDHLNYTLSRSIGEYAPRTVYCEVIINNNYAGLYVLQEKIKQDDNRVDIVEMEKTDVSLPLVSGGFITKSDKVSDNDPAAWTMSSISGTVPTFIHDSPDPDEITQEQHLFIKNWFLKLGTTAQAKNSSQADGYPSLIDIPSFVNFMIINELSANVDAYQYSTFFHKDRNGKLRAGPIWDLNLTYGNDLFMWGYDRSKFDQWQFDNGDNVGARFWKDLFDDANFKCYLYKRWTELTQDGAPLSLNKIYMLIDETETTISEAVAREQVKWGTVSAHTAEVAGIKTFLSQRKDWMTYSLGLAPKNCLTVATPPLVLTRIMYDPDTNAEFTDASDQEFIEIKNNGNETVDLTGVYFSNTGFTFQFHAGTMLPAGGVIQIANDHVTFKKLYGYAPFGEFTRNLSNSGQKLTLADAFGNVIDEVIYDDSSPWPDANGNGSHIKLMDASLNNAIATNWVASNEDISSTETVVGVEDEGNQTLLYPNPATNLIVIEAASSILALELRDVKGRLLNSANPNTNVTSLNVGHYANGLYFVSIKTKEKVTVKKILKE